LQNSIHVASIADVLDSLDLALWQVDQLILFEV
jgi:hypothetical protein